MSRILSLCGGGTSGYMTASVLAHIENELGVRTLQNHFDLVAGVSTGALIGALIVTGHSASDIKRLYTEVYDDIFGKKRYVRMFTKSLYDNQALSEKIKTYIGDITLGEVGENFMCNAIRINYPKLKTKFWKSWSEEDSDYKLADVVQASASAPLAFEPKQIGEEFYYDGGLAINDPTIPAYIETRDLDAKYITFQTDNHKGFEEPQKIKGWRLIPQFAGLALDGAEDMCDYIAKDLIGDKYYAVNPNVYLDIASNDWVYMDRIADTIWEEEKDKIMEFVT